MRVRRLGFTSIITIMFILGWFLNGWSAPPTEEREHYKKEAQEKCFSVPREGGFPFATPVSPTARVASADATQN